MPKKLVFAVIGLLLTYPMDCILAQGADVVLLVKSGEEISGELLSVRDSSLIISTLEDADIKELSTQRAGILAVRNEEVFHVVIKGKSNILKGMGLGTLIGGGFGGFLGLASGDDPPGWFSMTAGEKAAVGAIAFGAVGFLVGTIAGVASSSGDEIVEPLLNQDFSSLKPVAKFSEKEPEFLKKIR